MGMLYLNHVLNNMLEEKRRKIADYPGVNAASPASINAAAAIRWRNCSSARNLAPRKVASRIETSRAGAT